MFYFNLSYFISSFIVAELIYNTLIIFETCNFPISKSIVTIFKCEIEFSRIKYIHIIVYQAV